MKILVGKSLVVDFENLPARVQDAGKGVLIVEGSELSGLFRLPFQLPNGHWLLIPLTLNPPCR